MNIHPLFVHFPIGLLVIYSILEICTYLSPRLRSQSWVFSVKAFILFTGVLGAFAALFTGGIAEELIEDGPRAYILEAHSPVAVTTTLLYLILACAYLVRIFDQNGWANYVAGMNNPFIRIWSIKKYVTHIILDTWLLPVLATIALIGMFITGALGAAIVYGPEADPFVSLVYHLFFVN